MFVFLKINTRFLIGFFLVIFSFFFFSFFNFVFALAETKVLSFKITEYEFWQKLSNNSYFVTGDQDTFIWTEESFSGDISLHVDIEGDAENCEGVIILCGGGKGFSKHGLIFNIAHDFQSIRTYTFFSGMKYLVRGDRSVNFLKQKHKMSIKIVGNEALLFLDEEKILKTELPANMRREGKIGLYKYKKRPEVTYSNIVLELEGKIEN